MKKSIVLLLCLALALSFAACAKTGAGPDATQEAESGGKLRVVATIFPVYDWAKAVAGDRAELTLLLDNGTDLHNYQPTADDIVKLADADVFLYIGGESDGWVDGVLASAKNDELITVSMMETLADRLREEELKDGMEAEDEHEDEEDEAEYDEHVWLSLKNAETLVGRIAQAFAEADPAGKAVYEENANAYIGELAQLDAQYRSAVDASSVKTLVFADRFPFRYMVEDYGLDYYAAFSGCSTESEAKIETIVFLANKIDELGLRHILQIETSRGDIPAAVRSNTRTGDQTIVTLNSMQSVGRDAAESGVTYLELMRQNLDALKEALGA